MIAAILSDPEPHAGKAYPLYGPVELDYQQIAAETAGVLGREVTYVPIELDEFRSTLEKLGMNPHFIQHMGHLAVDYREGVFAGTNDAVRTLTGVEPLSVSAFAERNKQYFERSAA